MTLCDIPKMNLTYIRRYSSFLDLKMILMTSKSMFTLYRVRPVKGLKFSG